MTNRSRRRFLTSALATTSLGFLAGCSNILESAETDTSTTSNSKVSVTKTIAATAQTVTTTTKTANDSSSKETTTKASSPPGSQETSDSAKSTITAKVPVETPETTSDETISVESALDWFINSLQSEGVNASDATTWRDLAKIIHTTDQTILVGELAGEIGTVAGYWARFTTKVETPPAELRVTLKDKSGDSIGGYSVMTKDAEAMMDGFMTTDEFSHRIVGTIRFSPDIPTTATTWIPSTTRTTTTTVPPESTTTSSQTTRDRSTTTTKRTSTTTTQSPTSATSTAMTETSTSTTTVDKEVSTTELSR